jgi:L-lactate dehydrogenase complex protein LldF
MKKKETFRARIRRSIADGNLQVALDGNARRRTEGRLKAFTSLPDHRARKQRAHAIKVGVIADLDQVLERFIAHVKANGIQVHRAADGEEAIRIFLEIAARGNARLAVKSKSMISEEIHFNHAVEASGLGMRVVETDLGEYIVQLRGERPSHILTPAVHLRREQVGQLFHEKLGVPYTEDIPEMVATARRVLREIFLQAEIGVSGVNFGVAETGSLCLVTNEGNGRMCTTVPPVHVALMGIERLVPTLDDLALFLSLLPRSATGQKLSVYTSLIHSPRRPGETEGPRERHLILVDNGRSAMRSSPLAEALYCLRCGACLNACPVFREIGGHAYLGSDGSIAPYPGPIGAVVSPGLFGCENYGQLSQASSLCGACREACPVDIDLPGLLLRVRGGDVPQKESSEGIGLPRTLKFGLKAFRLVAQNQGLFSLGQRLGTFLSLIYSPRRPYMHLPRWTGWGFSKDFPRLAARSFHRRWKHIQQNVREINTDQIQSPASLDDPAPVMTLVEKFVQEFEAVGGRLHRVSEKELPGAVASLLKEDHIDPIQCAAGLAQMEAFLQESGISTVHEADPQLRAGITAALVGIADTGSLLLVAGERGALTASLLPEIHIVVLRSSQLVPSLADALAKEQVRSASAAVIITGPSRTGDIEMALTIGVHGPREIHVFLVDDARQA